MCIITSRIVRGFKVACIILQLGALIFVLAVVNASGNYKDGRQHLQSEEDSSIKGMERNIVTFSELSKNATSPEAAKIYKISENFLKDHVKIAQELLDLFLETAMVENAALAVVGSTFVFAMVSFFIQSANGENYVTSKYKYVDICVLIFGSLLLFTGSVLVICVGLSTCSKFKDIVDKAMKVYKQGATQLDSLRAKVSSINMTSTSAQPNQSDVISLSKFVYIKSNLDQTYGKGSVKGGSIKSSQISAGRNFTEQECRRQYNTDILIADGGFDIFVGLMFIVTLIVAQLMKPSRRIAPHDSNLETSDLYDDFYDRKEKKRMSISSERSQDPDQGEEEDDEDEP